MQVTESSVQNKFHTLYDTTQTGGIFLCLSAYFGVKEEFIMSTLGVKKTLNLHKYRVRVDEIVLNWKIIIPVIFALAGLIAGCMYAKGEGALYQKVTAFFLQSVVRQAVTSLVPYALRCLLVPTLFAGLLFFFGLSACGGFIANIFPFIFTFFTGMISYYMYLNYTLKGLAYCVIIIFPYAVFSLVAIILCTCESINMSEFVLRSISKSNKFSDYGFTAYYRSFLKNCTYILLAAGIKIVLEYLFGSLFVF